jgi:hypothetical protein
MEDSPMRYYELTESLELYESEIISYADNCERLERLVTRDELFAAGLGYIALRSTEKLYI